MNNAMNMIGDYVRHLEEENEELKKRNKELEEGFKATTDELCEYATKIDKAIEYMEKEGLQYFDEDLYYILTGDKENE